MKTAHCNDGTVVSMTGNFINTSKGESYVYSGRTLVGPRGLVSMNVGSVEEAFGMVCGMHGGKKF